AELEFVARIVDRPGAVREHEHALLDARHHGVERRRTWLYVEVGHAIDRWTAPAIRPCIGDTVDARPCLGTRATKWPDQQTLFDHILTLGLRSFVIEGKARRFLRPPRNIGYIEQRRAVLELAEHIQRHEARAGIVALVP